MGNSPKSPTQLFFQPAFSTYTSFQLSFPMCLFLLSYILRSDNVCFCARLHPFPLLYLLSIDSLSQEADSMNYNIPSTFQLGSTSRQPQKGIRSGEESEVRFFVSVVTTSCKVCSGWLRPSTEGHLLILKQLLCRLFFFQVNFSHPLTPWVLDLDTATAVTLTFNTIFLCFL